jgi:SecD/SecF fusion protein
MERSKKKLIQKIGLIIVIIAITTILFIPILKNTKLGLDLAGGFEVLYEVKSIDGGKVTKGMVNSTYKTISRRIDSLGVTEPNIIVEGTNRIRVQLAGVTNSNDAKKLLSQAANLTFRDTKDNLLMNSDVLKSGGARIGQDQRGYPAVALSIKDKETFMKVTSEISKRSDNRIVIWLDFEEGEDSYEKEKDKCGNIDLDNIKCLSAATVSQGFSDDVIIQGNFTLKEVESLVQLINSGSLATKLEEVSSKTVNASFGVDSLNKTVIAGIVGISLIMIFVTFVYKFAGFIASVGLFVYAFLTFLTFWLVGGVLTLPGIAAVVIGIGMAIDSSVITFARIKDELKSGSRLKDAFIRGNKNSFASILDSNLTTLLAAVILFIFGESSVKGFATMLIISIIVTMAVMVFLTRELLRMFVNTDYFNNRKYAFVGYKPLEERSKFINKIVEKYNQFDYVKPKNKIYVVSILILVICGIFFGLFGFKLGIDFKGGSSITLKSDYIIKEEQLASDIKDLGYDAYEIETLESNRTSYIKISETLSKEEISKTEQYFKEKYDAKTDIGVVSNIVKKELTKNAIISFILASIGIIIYVSIRFTFSYAVGGIVALFHDVFFMVAVFVILRLEVDSMFIAALLSIIGYSINDTIVTFDRIRENIQVKYKNKIKKKEELVDIVNLSLNQTLIRSMITTITTLIPVVVLILIGSHEIFNFNLALLFGLISGVYSSVFIACQLWLDIEKKNIGKPPKKKWYEDDEKEVEELKIKGINS